MFAFIRFRITDNMSSVGAPALLSKQKENKYQPVPSDAENLKNNAQTETYLVVRSRDALHDEYFYPQEEWISEQGHINDRMSERLRQIENSLHT